MGTLFLRLLSVVNFAGDKILGLLDVEKLRLEGKTTVDMLWEVLSPTICGTLSVASVWQRSVYLLLVYLFHQLIPVLQKTRIWRLGNCPRLITPLHLSAEMLPFLRHISFREVREEELSSRN
jgi:hypothetical protein